MPDLQKCLRPLRTFPLYSPQPFCAGIPSPITMDASTNRLRVRFADRGTYPPPRPLTRALRFTPAAGGRVPDGAFLVVPDAVSDSSLSASLMFGSYREPIPGSPPAPFLIGGCSAASLLIGGYSEPNPDSPPPSQITGGYLAAPLLIGRYIQPIPGSPPASLLGGPGPSPPPSPSLSYRRVQPPLTVSIPRPPPAAPTSLSLRRCQPNLTVPLPPHSPIANTPLPPLRTPSAGFPSYPVAPTPPAIVNPLNFDYYSPSPSLATLPPASQRHPLLPRFSPPPSAFNPRRCRPQPLTFSRRPVAPRNTGTEPVPGLLTLGFRARASSSRSSSSSSPPVPPPRLRQRTRSGAPPDERDHRWECCNCGAISTRWEFLCSACRVHGRGAGRGRGRCCLMRGEEGWVGDGGGGSEESGSGEPVRWEGWGGGW